jgi:thiamine pyrophosphate-dependent acetolactate synthase large subunit-like protein
MTRVYEAIADAAVDEGVEAVFAVMGDANMYLLDRLAQRGVRIVYARHEGGAVGMAEGYARSTGKLGVCSVTCGPGLTLTATSLIIASRARTPLLILGGEAPARDPFYNQAIDQRRFVEACESNYVQLDQVDGLARELASAFYLTRARGATVLGSPFDFQQTELPDDYAYASFGPAGPQAVEPASAAVDAAVGAISQSRRPVILAGRGAGRAAEAIEALAEQLDARLATSLMGLGMFEGNPRNLGLSGGFSGDPARELFARADCIIAVGAGLGQYTTDYGRLYGDATIVQIDIEPENLIDGRRGPLGSPLGFRSPDVYVQGDSLATVRELSARLEPRESEWGPAAELSPSLDGEVAPAGTVHPGEAMLALERAASERSLFVIGLGHFWWFAITYLKGRRFGSYQIATEFGSIGQGLTGAIGTAVGRPDRDVVVVEGDASFMMAVNEIDTAVRHDVDLLVFVMNNHGLGAEYLKLEAKGFDSTDARIRPPDIVSVVRGMGAKAVRVESIDDLPGAIDEMQREKGVRVIDLAQATEIMSEPYRRALFGSAVK